MPHKVLIKINKLRTSEVSQQLIFKDIIGLKYFSGTRGSSAVLFKRGFHFCSLTASPLTVLGGLAERKERKLKLSEEALCVLVYVKKLIELCN